MFHATVCSKCEVEFRPSKNGVEVVDYASFGPYKIWEADEWECPSCHTKVITGFADRPIHVNTLHDGGDGIMQAAIAAGRFRANREWEPPHRDLDTIDLEHDLGTKWLTDPWER